MRFYCRKCLCLEGRQAQAKGLKLQSVHLGYEWLLGREGRLVGSGSYQLTLLLKYFYQDEISGLTVGLDNQSTQQIILSIAEASFALSVLLGMSSSRHISCAMALCPYGRLLWMILRAVLALS